MSAPHRIVLGYLVTGVLRNGKRFKLSYPATAVGYMQAMCINLWQGSVWEELPGKPSRKLLKRVWN